MEGNLLALEDMLIELLLQALVGQVDAQLFEAVLLEGLKAVDVQDADRAVGALGRAYGTMLSSCKLPPMCIHSIVQLLTS